MSQLTIAINGQNYRISCDDGQEEHLLKLAADVDGRVREIVSSVGQVGDARILVMACLLMADEMSDLSEDLNVLQTGSGGASDGDAKLVSGLDALVERVESIASRLEGT